MGQQGVSQEAKKFCAKMFFELGNKTQQEVSGGALWARQWVQLGTRGQNPWKIIMFSLKLVCDSTLEILNLKLSICYI